jgi:serine/threonine-protein kinase
MLGSRYQVGELLGYGGMAEVHRGRDLRLGRDVAIKMLRTDLARDQTFQMRFRREAQNAATLNHPGIVAVYDTGEETGLNGESLPYIVMEFVSGRTLKEVLAAERRLQPRRALEIVADICAALEFSHRHGIIHRDIKPGNVMLTPNGQVKVMDFGIARALASGASTMTQTSAVIGTAQYLSPEQARGEAVDARSDVYAAGCVLFELVCGHPPFVGDSPVSVAYQHVREEARAPSDVNPDVGPDIDAVVLKALAKNPANRYQSAGEMRADVLRAAAGRPVLATPVMRDDPTALVGAPVGAAGNGYPTMVGEPERRTPRWVVISLIALSVLAVAALVVGLILSNRDGGAEQVPVPNVVGETEERAIELITEARLEPVAGEPNTGDECEVGLVVSQEPEFSPTTTLSVGSEVTYVVCTGPDLVVVPSLVGSSRDNAQALLEERDLVAVFEDRDSEEPEGEVLSTDPEAGDEVAVGSRVTVVVSRGNQVEVPDVTGQNETTARANLEAQDFEVIPAAAPDPPESPDEVGTVASQDPPGGETRNRGSRVTIFVFEDGEPLTVSDASVAALVATISWDNDFYGPVTINWGDGASDEGDGEGEANHAYAAPGDYTITVTDADDPSRTAQTTVTIGP